jgi:hypothetical protein
VVLHVNAETETDLEIFYRNTRTFSNKQTELLDNVCYVDYQNACLTETCLNYICFCQKLFPDSSITLRSDSVCSTKCSATVLTAVSSAFDALIIVIICSFMTNSSGSKFTPKVAAVYLLVTSAPSSLPTIPKQPLFLNILYSG